MLLHLYFLLSGCFCYSCAEMIKVTVMQNTDAELPCPHAQGDVTWSRHIKSGELVTLLTITDGQEKSSDKRFSSQDNNKLVIRRVVDDDTSVYLCNGKPTVYLEVTKDPNMVDPTDQGQNKSSVTPRKVDLDQKPHQPPSDLWKVPVGVLLGAALVLVAMFTLRLWKAKKAARNKSEDTPVNERVYEEISDTGLQSGLREVENPYHWSEISDASNPPLYSTVNKVKTEERGSQSCVYFFTQNAS